MLQVSWLSLFFRFAVIDSGISLQVIIVTYSKPCWMLTLRLATLFLDLIAMQVLSRITPNFNLSLPVSIARFLNFTNVHINSSSVEVSSTDT